MGVMDEADRVEPASAAEWGAWLSEHHAAAPGVWLVTARRSAERALSYEDSVLEALRFGWVDSTQKPVDERRSMMWFSPRRPGSVWTGPNKARVARLEDAGRMEEAGRAAVEAAKRSGMWTLMDPVEALEVPDDLAAALASYDGARAAFDGFTPGVRKQILAWIVLAKKPETRAARITTTAEQAAAGKPSRS